MTIINHDLVLACFSFSLMAVHLPKNIYNFIWRSIHKNQAFNAYMDRVSYLCEMSVFNLLGKAKKISYVSISWYVTSVDRSSSSVMLNL